MTYEDSRRLGLVDALITMTMPLAEVIRQLATMNWDYDGTCVELNIAHLEGALQRYLRGETTEGDIELWANQVEGRDDVQFENEFEEQIGEVLYELANPSLTQPLNHERARELIRSLNLP